jgi:Ca2+-binding EF-hand superfamily protein
MLSNAFSVIDTLGTGVLSAVQMYRVMDTLGERLSMDELAGDKGGHCVASFQHV